jgi:hypothetical protein
MPLALPRHEQKSHPPLVQYESLRQPDEGAPLSGAARPNLTSHEAARNLTDAVTMTPMMSAILRLDSLFYRTANAESAFPNL